MKTAELRAEAREIMITTPHGYEYEPTGKKGYVAVISPIPPFPYASALQRKAIAPLR